MPTVGATHLQRTGSAAPGTKSAYREQWGAVLSAYDSQQASVARAQSRGVVAPSPAHGGGLKSLRPAGKPWKPIDDPLNQGQGAHSNSSRGSSKRGGGARRKGGGTAGGGDGGGGGRGGRGGELADELPGSAPQLSVSLPVATPTVEEGWLEEPLGDVEGEFLGAASPLSDRSREEGMEVPTFE